MPELASADVIQFNHTQVNSPLNVKVQLFVALAVVVVFVSCKTPQSVASGMSTTLTPKLEQFIFCSDSEAEGILTVTINAPEYIKSVSHDFFVRHQRSLGELSAPLFTEAKWQGGNCYPRESPSDNGFEKRMFEALRCKLVLRIVGERILGNLKIEASFYKNRYKSTETISFPLERGGAAKFEIVELTVSELKLKNATN